MYNHAVAIGADIGKYAIKIAAVKFGGDIITSKTYDLVQDQSTDYICNKVIDAVREIRQKIASDGINPVCVGIAAKGFVDHQHGVVLGPDQGIKNWTNVPLAKIVNKETGLPVYVGNDANLMTIAEHRFGAARGQNDHGKCICEFS